MSEVPSYAEDIRRRSHAYNWFLMWFLPGIGGSCWVYLLASAHAALPLRIVGYVAFFSMLAWGFLLYIELVVMTRIAEWSLRVQMNPTNPYRSLWKFGSRGKFNFYTGQELEEPDEETA